MAVNYSVNYNCSAIDLPLLLEVKTIKNVGQTRIYIFDPGEDIKILSLPILNAFNLIVINPGEEIDLTINPFIPNYSFSGLNRAVTVHSNHEIDIETQISGPVTFSLTGNTNHPWNGGKFPDGSYTKKYSLSKGTNKVQNNFTIDGIAIHVGDTVIFNAGINVENESKCTCSSLTLFNSGCICGHFKRKKWGL